MQKILKNEKGSVALFILLTALFFLVVVTSVGVSFKNKEAQIDKQYEKIKISYEKDVNQVYDETIYYEYENLSAGEKKAWNVKKVSNIGKKVNYVAKYSNDLIWRILYADNDYLYLISSKLDENDNEIEAQRTNYGGLGGVGLINQQNTSYSGAANITDAFLKSLNSKWHTYLEDDDNSEYRTSESAKSIAWFMDQSRWANWKDDAGVATYAIGGPTIELLIKSFNATARDNLQPKLDLEIINGGYDPKGLETTLTSTGNMFQHTFNDGIYHLSGPIDAFWLASPGGNNTSESDKGLRIRTSGGNNQMPYSIYFGWSNYNLGLRPVAILPMDAYVASDYHILDE